MKKIIFFTLLMSTQPLFAERAKVEGGDSVNNGGAIWACVSGPTDSVFHRGMLTDIFEARNQFQLELVQTSESDPFKIYAQRKAWLEKTLPDMHEVLKSRFKYVEDHLKIIEGDITDTKDYETAVMPYGSTCSEGEWKVKNIANFKTDDERVFVNKFLWESPLIPSLDKAALLFHEAVYYWMRSYTGTTTSNSSRKIVGYMFADENKHSPASIKEEITKIVGTYPNRPNGKIMCAIRNTKRNQVYPAYNATEAKARFDVRKRCSEEPDPRFCVSNSLECSDVGDELKFECIGENNITKKIFSSKGRSLLEAQFSTHLACFMDSREDPKKAQACPDFAFMECYE